MFNTRGLSVSEGRIADKIAARTNNQIDDRLTYVGFIEQGYDTLFTICILLDSHNIPMGVDVTKRCTYGGSKMNDEHNPQLAEDVAFQRAVRNMLGVDVMT